MQRFLSKAKGFYQKQKVFIKSKKFSSKAKVPSLLTRWVHCAHCKPILNNLERKTTSQQFTLSMSICNVIQGFNIYIYIIHLNNLEHCTRFYTMPNNNFDFVDLFTIWTIIMTLDFEHPSTIWNVIIKPNFVHPSTI